VNGYPPTSPTAYFGGIVPVTYTQRKSFKFSGLLLGCLGQLRLGMANVLAVRVHSDTHKPDDLPQAIAEIDNLVRSRDDEYFRGKGFESAADFVGQFQAPSGVVVKSDWVSLRSGVPRNYVWLNPIAGVPLPGMLADHLRSM
jgi:hypothetical protein